MQKVQPSGPITTPRSGESPRVRRAPAYDIEQARAFIPVMPEIRRVIDGIPAGEALVAFGAARPSAAAMAGLEAEKNALLADGHHAAFVMIDLATRAGVAYNIGARFCTQSTIKAIYVGALLESRPEALDENGRFMREAILYSSNEAYEGLRAQYGADCLRAWCREAGVDERMADPPYPRDRTARDMLKLWTRLYCFLNGEQDPRNFAAYYADSIASATGERLGGRYPVQTKAGWENGLPENADYDPAAEIPLAYRDGDPLNDECAINDTGIVYTERGPYIFIIYSDWPFGIFRNYTTPNPLLGLAGAMCEAQAEMAGGENALSSEKKAAKKHECDAARLIEVC